MGQDIRLVPEYKLRKWTFSRVRGRFHQCTTGTTGLSIERPLPSNDRSPLINVFLMRCHLSGGTIVLYGNADMFCIYLR